MPEPTRLQLALADAVTFAREHGLGDEIDSGDFAVQRSDPGWQHATYLGAGHIVSVTIDPDGEVALAVGEVFWIHDQTDEERDPCECCEEGDGEEFVDQYRGRLCTTVPLPGDGTPPPALEIPPYAVRDANGAIRRARDGLFIVGPEATAATVAARLAAYNGNDSAYANTMRTLYRGALEVITAEADEAVSVGA